MIYYFHHESDNERLIKIYDSFDVFLKNLVVYDEENQKINTDNIEANYTEKFIELVKKWKDKDSIS